MNKKIGIVSIGYAWLPCEPGPSRFYYIAKLFAENGYDVELITSSFQHFEKKQRDKDKILEQGYPFEITFIDVPSYKKNIDIRRVYSNHIAKKRIIKYLNKKKYDVIYCSIPANDIAAGISRYCRKSNTPCILDIEDLWPEAMKMVIRQPILQRIIFPYFCKDAETAYRNADAVIGTSEEYTNRAFQNCNRTIPSKTIYVGCDLDKFDAGVETYSALITKPQNEFWVTYAGSIGTSYDIRTLVEAAGELLSEGLGDIKIKILGTGPLKKELEQYAKEIRCTNVEFLGYVDYPKMAAYLSQSDVLVNSYVKGAPQSIVNKIGDYLAAEKPMINTLENPEFEQLVNHHEFGVNIEPENSGLLAETVLAYYNDRGKGLQQGKQARKTAETFFDYKITYLQMVSIADELVYKDRENPKCPK